MYIWLAINVDEQLSHLRSDVKRVTDDLCVSNHALTLPLHISLRISFYVEDAIFEQVVDRIGAYYATLSPFAVETDKIELNVNIVWLKMIENRWLEKIHRDLVEIMLDEFAVPPHPFDSAFLFHTTLFMDGESGHAEAAYNCLQQTACPSILTVNRLVIGCSETGRAGDYRVYKEYYLESDW